MVELPDRADLLNAEIQTFPEVIAANPAIDALTRPHNRPPEDGNASMHCHHILNFITSRQRKNEYSDCSIRRQKIIICEKYYTFKDVRSLRVNIDRALIFGYDLHEHFMQLILKFGQYLQHSLFIT